MAEVFLCKYLFRSCKAAGDKAENPETKEKQPVAKKAGGASAGATAGATAGITAGTTAGVTAGTSAGVTAGVARKEGLRLKSPSVRVKPCPGKRNRQVLLIR